MSALPPKADIDECDRHVRFVPNGDICPHKNAPHKKQSGNGMDAAAFRRNAPT